MAQGLLQLKGTIDILQFWPENMSDGDTVTVTADPDGFEFSPDPAHNEPFHGLHARLDHLERGQLRALERLREALREPKRVVDVFGALFSRPINSEPTLLSLATGEAVACINHLLHRGEAVVDRVENGVAWYRAA